MRRRLKLAASIAAAVLALGVSGIAGVAAAPDTAPTATVSVPTSNQSGCQCLRGTVTVTATVSATTGRAITGVDIQVTKAGTGNWTTVATAGAPPYSVDVDTTTLEPGGYDFRAVATDTTGETGASAPARDRVIANNVGYVALADPGTVLHGSVKLTATVETGQDTPASVSFQRSPSGRENWITVAETTSDTDADGNPTGRFSATLDTTSVPDSRQDLRVVATDAFGQPAFVAGALRDRIVDNTAPSAGLTDPGGPLHGVVTLTAVAQDDGAGVAAVRFERSPAGAGTWSPINTATRPPYRTAFDSRLLEDGRYDLRVVATDRAGNAAAAPVVSDVAVENPGRTDPGSVTIENAVAPARDLHLVGAVAGSAQHETWAYGFTSAGPASAGGQRLPYTAAGHDQVVLLRYTDDGGWQIADVLRNPDGSPFQQVVQARLALTGRMAPTGEAWIAVSQQPPGKSSWDVSLFHRAAGGGRFLFDAAASTVLKPLGDRLGLGGAELRLGQGADGQIFGTLRAPSQAPRSMPVPPPAGGRPVTIQSRLDYGALVDGVWTRRSAALPRDFVPRSGEIADLKALDPTAPASGWGAIERSNAGVPRPLLLARYDSSSWSFVPAMLDALDLTDAFGDGNILVDPQGLRADAGGVWITAGVSLGRNAGQVIAYYDAGAAATTRSWCSAGLPRQSAGCGATIDPDHPAALPERVFGAPDGDVGLALQSNTLALFAHGDWSPVAAPGFTPGDGRALFSGPQEGWLAGTNALGRITARPSPDLVSNWPQSNRSPLTGVALPPGAPTGVDASGALAVGLDGTALRYDAGAGWQVTPTPSRARRIALRAVAFSGPSSAVAVGQVGTILRWDGQAWSEDPQSVIATQSQLNAVAFGRGGDGWAVGAFGTILHFDGSSWRTEQPPSEDQGTNITSVAVAGDDVFAVAGGNLITRASDGTWRRVAGSQLPDPAPVDGTFRLVSGLPDGGVVAAGRSVVVVRPRAAVPFEYATQPLEGIVVALAAFRDGDGAVRAFVSVAPSVLDDNGVDTRDVAGFPSGDGELLRQTSTGWQDLTRSQYPGVRTPGDGAMLRDPVLAVGTGGDGRGAWAVGGYAGTVSAARLGTNAILPARPAGWRTSAIWRYDTGGSAASPALAQAQVVLPAKPQTVSFAYFSSPMCKSQCAVVRGAQPDVNLRAATTQIATFARQPGGPAFAVLGGNARGPIQDADYNAGAGAADFAHLGDQLTGLGDVPLYAAYGPRDGVPTRGVPSQPWADAFAQAPAPFGRGAAPSGIDPAGAGGDAGAVHRYYAFDARQNGGTLRIIVLDNAAGSLEKSDGAQPAWLDGQLAEAQARDVPVVVIAARPLRPSVFGAADDAGAVARKLAAAGVLGVFTTSGSNYRSQVNQKALVPETPDEGEAQIPEYEGATLGYQQTQNNGVLWYSVSVDTAARKLDVKAIPVVDSLALKPLAGLEVDRSSTLSFEAVGRRPPGSIATPPNDDGFPGFDNYVSIPASSCSTCIAPSYSFKSSDQTIGDFVVPSGPGSRFPKLDASGKPTSSSASGLFCAYNTGTTTVSITSGLLSASLPVTVRPGDIGRPCGTVFRAGVGRVVVVPSSAQVSQSSNAPSGAATPPPPPTGAPATAAALPSVVPPPPPAAPVAPRLAKAPPAPAPAAKATPTPFPSPAPVPNQLSAPAAAPPVAVPLVPPTVTPIPPGGAASAQAAARRKEKAVKEAKQSAYTTRPAGASGNDWFFPAVGGTSVLALLMIAGGMRAGPRARVRPAFSTVHDVRPPASGPPPRRRR